MVKIREVSSTVINAPRETVFQILTQGDRVATAGTVWEKRPLVQEGPERVGTLRGSFQGFRFSQESLLSVKPLERVEVKPARRSAGGHEAWYVLTPVNGGRETRLTHGAAWGPQNLVEEVVGRLRGRNELRRAVEQELATIKTLAEKVERPPEF
ncbi:MAG TPA: hypothetical protein VNZ52_08185 [Candidatus Thermoplasmatota archaeon]|nr:hypothetical protein [Candidatus Thermoplasmatota archaeon]